MQFNADNKVIIQSMDRTEAMAFVKFLESEIARHFMDIDNAQELINKVKDEFAILDEDLGFTAMDLNEAWHGDKCHQNE